MASNAKKTLDDRIEDLETLADNVRVWLKVIAILAVTFGIAGAWGLSILKTSATELSTLKENIATVKGDVTTNLTGRAEQAVRSALAKSSDTLGIARQVAAFNLHTCPAGWNKYARAAGRYIVGLREDGDSDLAAFIGTALENKESRPAGQHAHEYTDDQLDGTNVATYKIPSNGGSYGHSVQTRTTKPFIAPEGTNAPYVQLLICEKD